MKPQCNTFPGNLYSKKHENLKHVFISWLIFSTFYWIAAYHKPFHVDEFYSWVYAERCTFAEILRLKEFGIGHPPLYHLIQKMMQQILPFYHFTYVRLANYLIGSLFVIIFVDGVLKYRKIPFFCYGVCCSATILDIFVFSRMWGLLCLSSLLLLWSGERYCKKRERRHLVFFLGVCVLGFLSDYNFILLVPYIGIVLFSRKSYFNKVLVFFFILLIIGWLTSWHLHVTYKALSYHLYVWHLFYDLTIIARELGTVLFNFWFEETLLVALLLALGAMFFDLKSRSSGKYVNQYSKDVLYSVLAGFVIFIVLNILILHESLRMNFAAPIILLVLTFLFFKSKEIHISDLGIDRNRIIIAIIGAVLVVLCVSPIFWKSLKYQRFFLILSPFILLLIFKICDKKVINTVSIVLIVSGLGYVLSNRVSDYYPPPSYNKEMPVIFQNEFSYSTQYIRHWKDTREEPYIIDQSNFEKYCKICAMGRNDIDFSIYDSVWIVALYNYVSGPFLPSDFVLIRKIENLTWLDRLQFKFMTPLHPPRQATFIYDRAKKSELGF